jgi:uncharacterized protein (DUF736 family)
MSDYDNTNRGALFKNDRKDSEKHPDYTGKLNVDGTDRYFAAWIKKSKSGNAFMSLSLGDSVEAKKQESDDFSMDIPF